MVVYDRWFLTPAVSDSEGTIYPKYSDHADITGFSGNTVSPDIVDDHYPALIQTFSDIEAWYIVRMYGIDNPGWNALNEIHNHHDTRTLADHANDVKPILDVHFPGLDRSGSEWAESFVALGNVEG